MPLAESQLPASGCALRVTQSYSWDSDETFTSTRNREKFNHQVSARKGGLQVQTIEPSALAEVAVARRD
jgi:hypothetical protein